MTMRRGWLPLPLAVVSVITLLGAGSVLAATALRASAHPGRYCAAAQVTGRDLGPCGPIACPLSQARGRIHPPAPCGCPIGALCACPIHPIHPIRSVRARRFAICPGSVSVTGAVTTPVTYSDAQLAAMPQTRFAVTEPGSGATVSATGVSLESLVAAAQPNVDPTIKNGVLRVTISVAGRLGAPVTFGEGELDPSFGNHPAYVALTVGGHQLRAPALLVPGDDQPIRDVPAVSTIIVGVRSPSPTAGFTPGTLTVEQRSHVTTLTAAQLTALPAETLQASFLAGTTTTDVTEVGPSLDEVLRAAHVALRVGTWVAGVGADGYVAVVTPAEQWVGGQYLQVSLNENGAALSEPRLVVDGDVRGGRYVSGLVDLVVGQGAPRAVAPPTRRGVNDLQ